MTPRPSLLELWSPQFIGMAVKRFLLLTLFVAISAGSAKADLEGADITGPSGDTSTGQTCKARCGNSLKKCTVSFKDGKVMINDKGGIYSDQFISVVTARTCRQRAMLLPFVRSCFDNQYDCDFTFTYQSSDGGKKSALIAFRPGCLLQGMAAHAVLERDLQVWIEDVLRPIGPSIQIETGPKQRPSSRPKPQPVTIDANSKKCKPPLSDYECSWSKYLDSNSHIKQWADANPAMAEKEKIRLGACE